MATEDRPSREGAPGARPRDAPKATEQRFEVRGRARPMILVRSQFRPQAVPLRMAPSGAGPSSPEPASMRPSPDLEFRLRCAQWRQWHLSSPNSEPCGANSGHISRDAPSAQMLPTPIVDRHSSTLLNERDAVKIPTRAPISGRPSLLTLGCFHTPTLPERSRFFRTGPRCRGIARTNRAQGGNRCEMVLGRGKEVPPAWRDEMAGAPKPPRPRTSAIPGDAFTSRRRQDVGVRRAMDSVVLPRLYMLSPLRRLDTYATTLRVTRRLGEREGG